MLKDDLHVVHARAAGLDVHKMEITATVRLSEAAGEPVCETRRFDALASGLSALAGWLASHRVEAASMEATGVYWEGALRRLGGRRDRGAAAQRPAGPAAARAQDGHRGQPLAGAGVPVRARHAELRAGPRAARASRALPPSADAGGAARPGAQPRREGDRPQRRAHRRRDHRHLRMNGRRILDGLVDRLDREAILGSLSRHVRGKLERLGDALTMSLRDADRVVLADLLREHDDLDRRIADLDRHLDEGMAEHDRRLRLLETIPGIDRVSAIAILVEASPDAVAVFGSAQRLAAWAGVCPGNRESAGKRQGAHTRPGAKHLRTILIACAHAAARTRNCQFHSYHKALLVRRGYKRAVVATAHKLARAVFAVLRDGQPYRDPEVDYEALVVKRNAPRWLAKLAEFGVLESREDGTLAVNWANA